MIKVFFSICWRDIQLGFSRGGGGLLQFAFLLVVASLFSFALGAEQVLLEQISLAVIWVSLLLSSLLSLSRLFEEDDEDGSLQLLWMQGLMPEMLVFSKILAHWCVNLLPMLIAVPILAQMLFMPSEMLLQLLMVLPVVSLLLSLIGGLGASLTLGLRRAAGLLGLLVFPLYIPVLIFAVSAVSAAGAEVQQDALMVLLAMLAVMLPVVLALSGLALQKRIEH